MATKLDQLSNKYVEALEAFELDKTAVNLQTVNDLAQELSSQLTDIRSNRGGTGITAEES